MRKLQKLRFRLARYIDQTIEAETFEARDELCDLQPFYEFFVDAAADRAQIVSEKRTDPFECALNRIRADRAAVFALRDLGEIIAATEVGKDHLTGDLIAWYVSDMQSTCDELVKAAAARECQIKKISPLEADGPRGLNTQKIGHDGFVSEIQPLMREFQIDETQESLFFFLSWVACHLKLEELDKKSDELWTLMDLPEPVTRLEACCNYLSVCSSLVDDILRFAKDIDAYIEYLLLCARGVENDASLAACLAIAHVLKVRHHACRMCSFFVTQLRTGLDDCRRCITDCAELGTSS